MVRQPIDIATRHSLEFIKAHLPTPGTILEVGCGDGELAAALIANGFELAAIDSDKDAITKAQEKGVNAIEKEWPANLSMTVDAILFTRSLHHIHPLDEAISAAHNLLNPHGTILVEDFAFDGADTKTINWFMGTLRHPDFAAALTPPEGSFISSLLQADDPVNAWNDDHNHHLHSIGSMRDTIAKTFDQVETLDAPYLYRYLIPALAKTNEAAEILDTFLNQEAAAIKAGEIFSVGKRIIAKSRSDLNSQSSI